MGCSAWAERVYSTSTSEVGAGNWGGFEKNMNKNSMLYGDCLNIMRDMPSDSVDLVFCSPPYEAARTYGIDFKLKGQAWND